MVCTSGTADTLHFAGSMPSGLKWKSPKARETARAPSTRMGPPPKGPWDTDLGPGTSYIACKMN